MRSDSSLPYLARIYIYPIKSLDSVAIAESRLLPSGALESDRQLALFDEKGNFVNGKRNPLVHRLRSQFDSELKIVSLQIEGTEKTAKFHIDRERPALEGWFSDYFGFPVRLEQNTLTGFPDDKKSPGPTVISTATIEEVAGWFPPLTVGEIRLRLRANLEIAGVPAFWEDRLFAKSERSPILLKIGEVCFEGINPCQRCIVPTRDSRTGEVYPNFKNIFVQSRKESLPPWTERDRFNHFYKLSVNTIAPDTGGNRTVQVGDKVQIIGLSERGY
ncbi:MAG: MOSC domain-containing protein [Oscillatoria sp. SIO1A7]|nr:MOSC domain-containing protein [Oscillatoria sp. SIO1A7]